MKPKNAAKVFLTLISLFLVCISSALAIDQVQQQTGIIDELKNNCNTAIPVLNKNTCKRRFNIFIVRNHFIYTDFFYLGAS